MSPETCLLPSLGSAFLHTDYILWPLHMWWSLMAPGLYPASLAASVDRGHLFLESPSSYQWTRWWHVFFLNKSDQENRISHWLPGPRAHPSVLPESKGLKVEEWLLPIKRGCRLGRPQPRASTSSVPPVCIPLLLHGITAPFTYPYPCSSGNPSRKGTLIFHPVSQSRSSSVPRW